MGDIATNVIDFAISWASTGSDYDALIAKAFPPDWAAVHRPVISRGLEDHTLYIAQSHLEPNGLPILCHLGHDFGRLAPHPQSRIKVIIVCKECGSKCETPRVDANGQTVLGHCNLVKVPLEENLNKRTEVQWIRSKSKTQKTSSEGIMGQTPSQSLQRTSQVAVSSLPTTQPTITPQLSAPVQPNTHQPQEVPLKSTSLPQRITTTIRPPRSSINARRNLLIPSSASPPNSPLPSPSPVPLLVRTITLKSPDQSSEVPTQRSDPAPGRSDGPLPGPTSQAPAQTKRPHPGIDLSPKRKRSKQHVGEP